MGRAVADVQEEAALVERGGAIDVRDSVEREELNVTKNDGEMARMDTTGDANDSRTASAVAPTAHTPGPWTFCATCGVERDDARAVPFTVRAALGCTPYGLMGDYRGDIVAAVEQNGADPLAGMAEANARLIAAAPELLAALKALTQDMRFSLHIGGNPNAINALVKQVDAAIAKAEGITPHGGTHE